MGYSRNFLSGLGWSGGLKIFSKLLTAGKLAILARLLSQHDFGLFSLTLVAISLFEVFTETGINTIIVQSKKEVTYFIDTAWVVSICRGLIIALVMILISFPMSSFYQEPLLIKLILLASLVPVIRGFINPAIVTFHKQLQFKTDTIYRFSLVVFDILASIVLALVLKNAYALILPIVLTAGFEVIVSFAMVRVKPRFKFENHVWKEIIHSSKWLNGISILDYVNKNIDDLIIGKILGTAHLGVYRNSYALSQSATADLGLSVIHAAFPIFSKLKDQPTRLKTAFIKVLASFSFILLIPALLFIWFPELIVQIVLGEDWTGVVPILPVLAMAGFLQGIISIFTSFFTALKYYWVITVSLALAVTALLITIIPLSYSFGLIGASWSIVISRLIALPILVFAAFKIFNSTQLGASND